MPTFSVDLHNHTPASADHLGPRTDARAVVEAALACGLDVYAVTDHLSCDFVDALSKAADAVSAEGRRRLLVVPGTELRLAYRGDEVHLTALFHPLHYRQLFDALMEVLGIRTGYVPFDERPFFTVEHDPVDAVNVINALGGIACLAHADRSFGDYRVIDTALFERIVAEPALLAVDLLEPTDVLDRFNGRGPSAITCSDSHSNMHIGVRRSLVTMEDLSFGSLKQALMASRVLHEVLV